MTVDRYHCSGAFLIAAIMNAPNMRRIAITPNGRRLIAASGVDDLIVVDSDDALLICHRDRAQTVKQIVERLKAEGREDLL